MDRHAGRAVIDEGVDHAGRREYLIAHEAGERLAGDALDHHGHEQEIGIIILIFPPGRESQRKLPRLACQLGGIIVADPKGPVAGHRHVLQVEIARQARDVAKHVGNPDRLARILRQLGDELADVVVDRDQAALLKHQESGRGEGLGDRGNFEPGPRRDGRVGAQIGKAVSLHQQDAAGLDQQHRKTGIGRLRANPLDQRIDRILEPQRPSRPFQGTRPRHNERRRPEPRAKPRPKPRTKSEHMPTGDRWGADFALPAAVRTISAGHQSLPAAAPAPQRPHSQRNRRQMPCTGRIDRRAFLAHHFAR